MYNAKRTRTKKSLSDSFDEIKTILQNFPNIKYMEIFDIGSVLVDSGSMRLIRHSSSNYVKDIIVFDPNASLFHITKDCGYYKSDSFVYGSNKCLNAIMVKYPEVIYSILRLPEILRIIKTDLFNK